MGPCVRRDDDLSFLIFCRFPHQFRQRRDHAGRDDAIFPPACAQAGKRQPYEFFSLTARDIVTLSAESAQLSWVFMTSLRVSIKSRVNRDCSWWRGRTSLPITLTEGWNGRMTRSAAGIPIVPSPSNNARPAPARTSAHATVDCDTSIAVFNGTSASAKTRTARIPKGSCLLRHINLSCSRSAGTT
jgi:hypothetical protein